MRDTQSPIAKLAQQIESALAARRAQLEERLGRVEQALQAYRLAAEARLAKEFAGEHRFSQASPPSLPSAERAAELLLAAVSALPELEHASVPAETPEAVPPTPSRQAAPTRPAAAKPSLEKPAAPAVAGDFPLLTAAANDKKLVVIGALSGRDKSPALPSELAHAVEWIDTEREGAHAIGNLPQRVRQGRVAALVILHRAVGHRHTDAVTVAARERDVPLAFAGQGGKVSLLRAFAQIEVVLSQREPAEPGPRKRTPKKT
jgi:hypothetical protein